MESFEIKKKKKIGDNIIVASMLGITPETVRMALNRPGSKRHVDVCNAMEQIIISREQLINS